MNNKILFGAFALLTVLVSCNKENGAEVSKETVTMNFTARIPQTKALFGTPEAGKYPVLWEEADTKLDLLVNYDKDALLHPDVSLTEDKTGATFSAEFTATGGPYTFVAVSPVNSVISANNKDKRFGAVIPSSQEPTASSPDNNAILLYAAGSSEGLAAGEPVNMTFHHVPAYLHLCFKNYEGILSTNNADVTSVAVTSSGGVLSGRVFVHPGDDDPVKPNEASLSGTVTATTSSLEDVWLAVFPADLSNETLTVVVNTTEGTMTKVLSFGSGKSLSSGKIVKLTIDMAGTPLESSVEYTLVESVDDLCIGDEVIIAAANYDMAISTTQGDNNRSATAVNKVGNLIQDPSDAVQIFTLEYGMVPGEYAFNTGAGYLYGAYEDGGTTGSRNWLRTKSELTKYGSWSIVINDEPTSNLENEPDKNGSTEHVAVINATESKRGYIRFNLNGTNPIFSAYAETSAQCFVHIYRREVEGKSDKDRFVVSMPDLSGNSGEFDLQSRKMDVYVFSNISWTAGVTCGGEDVSSSCLNVTEGSGCATLKLSIPEASTDKEYIVTVTAVDPMEVSSYSFTITQVTPSLAAGDILWSETFEGAENNAVPSEYFGAAKSVGTYCWCGLDGLSYSEDATNNNIKVMDGTYVYYDTTTQYKDHAKEGDKRPENILIRPEKSWTAGGISIPSNVRKAELRYRVNSQGDLYVASSSTEGVTFGAHNVSSAQYYTFVDGTKATKKYYLNKYSIEFDSDVTSFDITFKNTNADKNCRFADFELVITELR